MLKNLTAKKFHNRPIIYVMNASNNKREFINGMPTLITKTNRAFVFGVVANSNYQAYRKFVFWLV